MSVNTSNVYGKISISDQVLAKVAAFAALECYGIVELVSRRLQDSIMELLKKKIVESWLSELSMDESMILNAGSGGTDYRARGIFVHLDIVEKYICQHEYLFILRDNGLVYYRLFYFIQILYRLTNQKKSIISHSPTHV